jgi:tetratricopeptide (TPR) repeat protein
MMAMNPRLTAILIAVLAVSSIARASVGDLPVGQPPPEFTLPTTGGGEVSVESEQGHPVVIVFGELYQENTCRALADLAEILTRTDPSQSVKVLVIVSENLSARELDAERRQAHVSFPVLMDPSRATFVAYGVISAIPCAVFLDAEGRVHRTMAGYGPAFVDDAEDELAFLRGQITEEELQQRRQGRVPEDEASARLMRRVRLGDQLRRRGLTVEARQQYETVLEQSPNHPEAHLGLALLELDLSDLDAAESQVRTVLGQDPNSPRGLKTLARIQLRRGDLDAAELTLQNLVHAAGEDAQTLYLTGRLLEARGDATEALKRYRQVCEAFLGEEGW